MKGKYLLVSLLLVALVMGGTGYGVSAGSGDKATGGGTFIHSGSSSDYASLEDKISFGFNAQSQGNGAKGQFHLINHDSGMKVSGTVSDYTPGYFLDATLSGTCTVDGNPRDFNVIISDWGPGTDKIDIFFGDIVWPADISGFVTKGNIQKHK
ncbi:MAG: hypothetical protein ISS58_02870 [Dehalococcoidales bacterium]|nr:hypothetical protein [Dehalococcoidales bacterium]